MKQSWQVIVRKIDALSLRERAMIFAMAAALLIALINNLLLDRQFSKQKVLAAQVKAEQTQIILLQTELQQQRAIQGSDPDAENRARLIALQQQLAQMHTVIKDMQKGLVSPDKMSVLLESILKRQGGLRLISLKTLPLTGLSESLASSASGTKSGPAIGTVYKHRVELVIQGNYLDMMNYMAEMEAMGSQLFWGKAQLTVDEYPKATLRLTVFTLSLDKQWLNL